MVFFDGGTNLIDSGMLRKLLSELGVLNVFDSQAGQEKAPADGQSLPGADQPISVEPDGGIGDGAGPITLPVEPGVEIIDLDGDRPMPVEPDGGIGDGADEVPIILPVEPGVEIVDLDGDQPMPVEPDGGIGDGAGPITLPVEPGVEIVDLDGVLVLAGDSAETFYFPEGGENAAVFGFDADSDILDLSATAGDFAGVDDLMDAVTEVVNPMTSDVLGISIDLGDGQMGFVGGVSADDLSAMNIVF